MTRSNLLASLIFMTLIAAVVVAAWQYFRTKRSQQRSGDPEGRRATQDALHAHTPDERR